jgi:acetylornithine deacetylase/succinyl-diaminopimelate desuccinylase-like protein
MKIDHDYTRETLVVVTEPTGLEVCLAHKGYLWIEVEIAGRDPTYGSGFSR